MSISSLLDRKLILQRATISRDSSGGIVRTYAAILSNIPASITPAAAQISADYARRDMIVNHHLYTTLDLDSAVTNGVRLGDRFADGTVYYLVKAVKKSSNAQISTDVMYQIDCEKIT